MENTNKATLYYNILFIYAKINTYIQQLFVFKILYVLDVIPTGRFTRYIRLSQRDLFKFILWKVERISSMMINVNLGCVCI